MLDSLAEAAGLACPLAISCATVVVAERVRTRRRRELLNRSLHELRRPLQALVLQARSAPGIGEQRRGQLELALEALAGLDRQVNGVPDGRRTELVEAATLARESVDRWRAAAALAGRRLELAWGAGRARLACDPGAVSRALDNLIANALEHGCGPVRVEGSERGGRLRIVVADGADAGGAAPPGTCAPGRARGAAAPSRAPSRSRAPDRRRRRRRARRAVRGLRSRRRGERRARAAARGVARRRAVSRRARAVAFAAAAALCAGLAAAATGGGRTAADLGELRQVVVATATLPARRPIRRGALDRLLELRRLPERFLAPDALTEPSQALGRRPAAPIPAGGYLSSRSSRRWERAPAPRPAAGRRPKTGRDHRPGRRGAGPLPRPAGRAGRRRRHHRAGRRGRGRGRAYLRRRTRVGLLDLRPAAAGAAAVDPVATDSWVATLALTRPEALRLIHAQSFARDLRLIGR